MLKTRIITAIIGIPLILGILYMGGLYWDVFFGLMGTLGLYEFYNMMLEKKYTPLFIPGYLLLYGLIFADRLEAILPYLIFVIMVIVVVYAIFKYPRVDIADISISITGALYLGLLLQYPLKILTMTNPFAIILFSLLVTWAADIGGYSFGKIWGKHKMAPLLSPKKTWEGVAGAVILPMLVTVLFFSIYEFENAAGAYILILGLATSIMAQLGDLFISSIKRYFEVKDSGNIIPGHGGVLDRFDSFLLVVPTVYYLIKFIS